MPRFEKWLTAIGPDAPVTRAARKALRSHLRAVEHLLGEAAHVSGRAKDDAEAVHQLRIWTRRAAAVLRLFDEVLPRRRAKWLKRKLRKIRRTAGEARDCDVLAEQLERENVPGLAHTVVPLRQRRRSAERDLAALDKSLVRGGKLRRRGDNLRDKVRWRRRPAEPEFGPWCRQQLQPLAAELFELAAADLSRDAALHQLRLAGKRLRYALELAPAALPPATHRRLYDELCDLQDRLGALCDAIVAVGRLREWREGTRDRTARKQLGTAISQRQRELTKSKAGFRRWWTARRRERMRRTWDKALGKRG
jgi:CHAD domain-containing protein